jgi:hypothetical protein
MSKRLQSAVIRGVEFKPGDRVVVNVPGFGDDADADVEIHFDAGALGVICAIHDYGAPQGIAVDVGMDCGVSQVFDQSDNPPHAFDLAPAGSPPPPVFN